MDGDWKNVDWKRSEVGFSETQKKLQSSKLSLPKPFLSVFLTVSLTPNEKECQAKPGAGPVPECLAGNPHQGRPNESAKTPSVSMLDLREYRGIYSLRPKLRFVVAQGVIRINYLCTRED